VDAWSLTSLEKHTGRPEVAPWLRGWVEEKPQTTIVWRTHLPVREDVEGWPRTAKEKKEIEDFFEAAPLHESEKLETETFRVANWLQERGGELLKGELRPSEERIGDEPLDLNPSSADPAETEEPAAQTNLRRKDIVALVLSSSGAYAGHYTLGDLTQERKSKAKGVQEELGGKIVVVEGRFSGLMAGLLDKGSDEAVETAEGTAMWSEEVRFRVRRHSESRPEKQEEGWWTEDRFVMRRDQEGVPQEWLTVAHFRATAQKEDSRSISKPQALSVHQDWARKEMLRITKSIGLLGVGGNALAIGAALHDEGKKASRWQRAFNAAHDVKDLHLSGPLAKTRGPINQAILDGYRHEFGSLPFIEEHDDFKEWPDDLRDLVLHLVAAHHGQARPVIATRSCDDGPSSLLEERARVVALRFARLQKRWGPWGLAWLEALMRAADQKASRDNEMGQSSCTEERAR
jgi:CRISPR-associated endonuclease/helicase Cas3